jgi:hypothetical protein
VVIGRRDGSPARRPQGTRSPLKARRCTIGATADDLFEE